MKPLRYSYKKGLPRLSVNKSNFKILKNLSSQKEWGRIEAIDRPGKTPINVFLPSRRQATRNQELFHLKRYLKNYYCLSPKQLKVASKRAKKYNLSIFQVLESRLDVILYRLHWVSSLFEARSFIKKYEVLLNGSRCSNPNTFLMVGDTIKRSDMLYISSYRKLLLAKHEEVPSHILSVDANSAVFLTIPTTFYLPQIIQEV